MEIKVTISLDEQTHRVLDKLIDTLAARNAHMPVLNAKEDSAPDKAQKAVEQARVAKTAEPEEVAEQKPTKANKGVSDGSDASGRKTPKVTLEDLRALAADVKTKTGDIGEVKALLAEYSAKNISAIPEDKWDEFAAKLKELL